MPRETDKIIEPIDAEFEAVVKAVAAPIIGVKLTSARGNKDGRITEADLWIPALRIANAYSGGFIATSDLILELEAIFNPTGADNEILDGRADTRFSQKVRNLVSHRNVNFIGKGYAEYDDVKQGIQITLKGRRFLEEIQG